MENKRHHLCHCPRCGGEHPSDRPFACAPIAETVDQFVFLGAELPDRIAELTAENERLRGQIAGLRRIIQQNNSAMFRVDL